MTDSPFLNAIADYMSVRRYSKRTVSAYLYWIRYFIVYHQKRHPSDMDGAEVERFLTYLAVERNVAAATQSVALNALAFFIQSISRSTVSRNRSLSPFEEATKSTRRTHAQRGGSPVAANTGSLAFDGVDAVRIRVAPNGSRALTGKGHRF